MNVDSLPKFSVSELNLAIGTLLERGFAPRFLLEATVSKPQIKKGHLWLTLTDTNSSINAVVWASIFQKLKYKPVEGDVVLIVGKINFWATRASLSIQIVDIRPTLSTVLGKFELVKAILLKEGLIDKDKKRALPRYPESIAILTSVPSSAHADIIRTAKESWPLTRLIVIPIPVQGDVAQKILLTLTNLSAALNDYSIQAVVIARGGGSREDLMVFDDEKLCRGIANFPVPVVTGIGHEDDWTVADLVADYRAATPTSAIVAILPSLKLVSSELRQRSQQVNNQTFYLINKMRQNLYQLKNIMQMNNPSKILQKKRTLLIHKEELLHAFSPDLLLKRGFAILKQSNGKIIRTINDVSPNSLIFIQVRDGIIKAITKNISKKRVHSK